MGIKLRKIIKNIPKAIKDPEWVINSTWRQTFPKDPEASRMSKWNYGNLARVSISEIFPGIEHVDITILKAFYRLIGTSLDIQEIIALCGIVKFIGLKNILEIGTYDGNTALNLAANSASDALITTMDLPSHSNKLNVPEPYVNVTNKDKIDLQYKNTKYTEKIVQIYADSTKIRWGEMPVPFDLVLIDGCHYYDYVKKDTENSLKHVKPGGIIAWHDYGMIKDVSKIVDETAKKIKIKALRGTRLAIGFVVK